MNIDKTVVSGQTRASDSSLLEPLYTRYFPQFVNDLRAAFGPGPPDPEDIAQRAFEKLMSRKQLASINNIEGYLWRAAQNLIVSELRTRTSTARREEAYSSIFQGTEGYQFSPERVLDAEQRISVVASALADMPAARRRAFELVRLHGFSHGTTARKMGISRPAVTKHVSRASVDLYRALGESPEGDRE
ncbi:MAG: RNA polymerase sigma factor [Pseudomonadota bacterium]